MLACPSWALVGSAASNGLMVRPANTSDEPVRDVVVVEAEDDFLRRAIGNIPRRDGPTDGSATVDGELVEGASFEDAAR